MKRTIKSKYLTRAISTAVLGATSVLALTYVPAPANTSAKLVASSTSSSSTGYYVVGSDGGATGFGATPNGTSVNGSQSNVVAAAANPTGNGYWTVTKSGQVVAHAGATFYGDTYTYGITGLSGSHPLNAPIVGIAATSNGQGYWLVAADGGVFDFGNAQFHGSTYTYGITGLSGSHPLNAPIVSIIGTPSGSGYWLVAADGGVFDFGNAQFFGSTYTYGITGLSGKRPLNAPIVGAVAAPDGNGYYLVGADGGVFDFGSAKFSGSTYDLGYTGLGGSHPLPAPITDIMPNPTGEGYYVVCKTGNVLAIGGAPSLGNAKVGKAVAIIPSVPVQPSTPKYYKPPQQYTPPTPKYTPPSPQQYTPPAPQQYTPPSPQQYTPPALALGTTSLSISNNLVNAQLTATGGDGGYTFKSTNLPSGLTLSSSGLLTGTLTETATTTLTFSVTVTDSAGVSTTGTVSLADTVTASGPLTLQTTTASASNNVVRVQLVASGGDGGYTFTSHNMPSGLNVTSSGLLSGYLANSATTTLSIPIIVTDAAGASVTGTVSLVDTISGPLSITTTNLSTYPNVNLQLGASGGSGYTWTAPTGLFKGLTLSSSGALTGTMSGLSTVTLPVEFTVTDSAGDSMTTAVNITYHPVQITTSTASFTAGQTGSVTLVTNVSGPYTFAVDSSTPLPSGLTLSSSGVLSGTPPTTDPTTTISTIYVLNSNNQSVGTESLTISISGGTTVAPSSISIQGAETGNWAGIVDSGTSTTSISGTFVVPTVSSTQPSSCTTNYSDCAISEWVGIDGFGNQYLIQAGVQGNWNANGTPTYYPWYEVITPSIADPEEMIPGWSSVSPGDSITVTLTKQTSGGWDIVLTDNTTGQSFNSDTLTAAQLSSQANPNSFQASAVTPENAEWIAETPDYNGTYAALPAISAGGNFTARSLSMGTILDSYAVTRTCSATSAACMTPTTDQTSPINYGSFFNLSPFGFTW